MKKAAELIKELGGQVNTVSQATWKDGAKVKEEWTSFIAADSLIESSGESLEDALQKLRSAKEEDASRPKVVYSDQLSADDFPLLDSLLVNVTLLELLEEPAINGEKWVCERLPAILSTTTRRLMEVYKHFYDKG